MRILYLIPEFPGQTHVLFWRDIEALRRHGHDVRLASTRRPASPCPHAFADEPCTWLWPYRPRDLREALGPGGARAALSALRVAEGGGRERARLLALVPAAVRLRRLVEEAAIDYVHGQSLAQSASVLRLAYEIRPFAYGLVLHSAIDGFGRNLRWKAERARLLVGVTGAATRDLRALGTGVDLATIACGVPLDRFVFREREPVAALRLVTVARLHPGKGLGAVVEAVARLVPRYDLRYTIVGEGPWRPDLERLVERHGLWDVVTLAGARDEAGIVEALHGSDLAVLASAAETTAIFVREAMATGLPAIMSDVGDARLMIDEGVEGFVVKPGDVAALEARIAWFCENLAARAAMGRAARRRAERDFDAELGPRALLAALGHGSHAPLAAVARA